MVLDFKQIHGCLLIQTYEVDLIYSYNVCVISFLTMPARIT